MTQTDKAMNTETAGLRIGAVVPTYRHVDRLGSVVGALAAQGLPVIVVDDGNAPDVAEKIAVAAQEAGAQLVIRAVNGGKGAAMKDGFRAARDAGWTHALQIDADGQHDVAELPAMLSLAHEKPSDVVCAVPVYDHTIPKGRKIGREITHFWVRVETLSLEISDSMCGFRIYPLADVIHVIDHEWIGDRMDFDTEILVQLNWRGLRVIEHPTRVVYPPDNTSNFRMFRDNVRISLMHTRLAIQAPVRVPIRMIRRLGRS